MKSLKERFLDGEARIRYACLQPGAEFVIAWRTGGAWRFQIDGKGETFIQRQSRSEASALFPHDAVEAPRLTSLTVRGTFARACPKCGDDDHIEISADIPVRLVRDESGVSDQAFAEDGDYGEDSPARCLACQFTAPYHRFHVDTPHYLAPPEAFDAMPAELRALGFEPELGGGGDVFCSIYFDNDSHVWITSDSEPQPCDSDFHVCVYAPGYDGEESPLSICSEDGADPAPGALARAARAAIAFAKGY